MVEDVMKFTGRYNVEGKMKCIDFKNAFDIVSRDFFYLGPYLHMTLKRILSDYHVHSS